MASLFVATFTVAATAQAGKEGGGGDATELRIDDIRRDVLGWLDTEGPSHLELSQNMSAADYKQTMRQWLAEQYVVVSAVTQNESQTTTNPERKVEVAGQEKTCRGFVSKTDLLPHILCIIERFNSTTQADQYRLIHHEYAGLAGLENNIGAASDYKISNQITDFLTETKALRLGVVKSAYKTSPIRLYGPVASMMLEALKEAGVKPIFVPREGSRADDYWSYTITDFTSSSETDGCPDGSKYETRFKYSNGKNYDYLFCDNGQKPGADKGSSIANVMTDIGIESLGSGWYWEIGAHKIECNEYTDPKTKKVTGENCEMYPESSSE